MAIKVDTPEARTFEVEHQKLSALYRRIEGVEAEMARARVRLEEINNSLGEADERQATKLRAEVVKLQQDLQSAAELERALRKSASAQFAIVKEQGESLKRQGIGVAFRAWQEHLTQIEAFVAEAEPLHGVAHTLGLGGERTVDAFTGLSLAWCPSGGQLSQWRKMTDELKVGLKKLGHNV
jgi:hypothetical protein